MTWYCLSVTLLTSVSLVFDFLAGASRKFGLYYLVCMCAERYLHEFPRFTFILKIRQN